MSCIAINQLLPALASHDVQLALTTRIGSPQADEPAPRRELRAAEQLFALDVLFPLVERAGLPPVNRYLTFREIEQHDGIAVVSLPNPNTGDGLVALRAFAPDLVVSIRYGAIFKSPAIAVPPLGILNLHAGLLPAYRGVLATFRALMAGEREIGCTLHYITDGTIDTGPVIGTSPIAVDPTRSLLWNVVALYPPAIAMMSDAIARVTRGEPLPVHAQSGGNYYTYPNAAEWDEFLRRGWRVADPSDLREIALRFMPHADAPRPPNATA
ncbi:MAG TPA: formyl transferase [Gemmatimonadaceae bacterium]|nr:formyl transferase [Gemmatimonadaceae bacterium]